MDDLIRGQQDSAPVLTGEAKRAVLAWMLTYQLEISDLKDRYAASTVVGWMINDFTKEFSDDKT